MFEKEVAVECPEIKTGSPEVMLQTAFRLRRVGCTLELRACWWCQPWTGSNRQDPFDQDDWDAYKHFMGEAMSTSAVEQTPGEFFFREKQNQWFVTIIPRLPTESQVLRSLPSLSVQVGQRVQIVGDDLLVTNPTRVKKAGHQQRVGC